MPTNSNPEFYPEAKIFHSQGLRLHYLDWGNEHLPSLIFLHGIQDHARSWDWAAALSNDWHVVAPDLRGHGDSDWSPDGAYLAPYLLQDLVELVDVLGCAKVSLVAHSFGGNAAARFAALIPNGSTNSCWLTPWGHRKRRLKTGESRVLPNAPGIDWRNGELHAPGKSGLPPLTRLRLA